MSELETLPLLDGLTAFEQRVVDAARCGDWAEPDSVVPVQPIEAIEDRGLQVRAELIRELLMGRRGELDPRGLCIQGARIVGELDLDHVTAVTGLVLIGCALPGGVTCCHARLRRVNLSGSRMSKLYAEGLRTDGNLILRSITATGSGDLGVVWLRSAQIGGLLSLHNAEITNDTGPGFAADDLRTDSDMSLQEATLTGSGEEGAVRLFGAHIGGQLDLESAEVTNHTGPGLGADCLRTNGDLILRSITATGSGEDGAVRLYGAHIGGQLNMDRAEVTNHTGPGLGADDLHTEGHLFLRNTTVTGSDENGTVQLLGAHIGGQLHLKNIRMTNDSGPLMVLSEAQIAEALLLSPSVVCPDARKGIAREGCPDSQRHLVVRGLAFPSLKNVTWQQWLHLLTHHTPTYLPQPYQQLAAIERAAGHDNNARQVLIAQQEDLRRRTPEALGGRLAQARHWLWGWLGRYGYRAHRLVTALALVLALTGALGYTAGQIPTRPGHHAAERIPPPTATTETPGIPCSTIELIGLGIDRGLPLGATGVRTRCDLDTTTTWGQRITAAIWILQALVWALATLAIAAYTGLIRKPT